MIEMHESPVDPRTRSRRWVWPIIAAVGATAIAVGVIVANRADTTSPAQASTDELADISEACTTWMDSDNRWGSSSGTWCQEMAGWMTRQVADGSMTGSMMWGNQEKMQATCRSWMNANPSGDRPTEWCESMPQGMRPHMSGDWDDWMTGPMMGG
jgi:hypothetical protein